MSISLVLTSYRSLLIISVIVLATASMALGQPARRDAKFGSIPLYFEENRGQADPQVRYIGRTGNVVALVTSDGLRVSSGGDSVAMRVAGANPKAAIQAAGAMEGVTNYYLGSRAITGLPHYQRVQASNIRPGIDLIYHGDRGELEYDLVIHPGADASRLRLKFDGGKRPELADNGDVVIKTASGELRQKKPRVWQDIGGKRREVECRYALAGRSDVRLVLGDYSASAELVVDPVISYSTFLNMGFYTGAGIAVDASGFAYVTGAQANSPVAGGGPLDDKSQVFITKLNPSGTALVYSTIVAGSGLDNAAGIAIDNAGNAYITGYATSNDFPFTVNAKVAGKDAFVIKLGTAGNIIYATALAGDGADSGTAIAVDSAGSAYVTGSTSSTNFPTTAGSFQASLSGGGAFVAKLNSSGQTVYATYLGGGSGQAIKVDASGNAYVGGIGFSNFPTTAGAFEATAPSGINAFLTKLNTTGSALIFSTYLGGSGDDYVFGLAIDGAGNSYVTGYTTSNDFPTTPNAFAKTRPGIFGLGSGFAAKLNASGTSLLYSTYLGGENDDRGTAIVVDSSGVAYVGGNTSSGSFPTTPGSLMSSIPRSPGCCLMFLVQLPVDGNSLSYSTYMGGSVGGSSVAGVALDGKGGVYVTGSSQFSHYPTTSGAYATVSDTPNPDVVVTKIDFSSSALCTPSVSPMSESVPGAGGPISFNLTLAPGCPWEAFFDNSILINGPTYGVVSSSPMPISGTVLVSSNTNSRTSVIHIGAATFTVNQGPAPPGPSPVLATTASGSDIGNTIVQLVFSDPAGATDIGSAQIDIGASLTAAGTCYLYYSPASNQIQLANDAGSFGAGLTLGKPGTMQNSQCALDASTSQGLRSGNNLSLSLNLSFKAAFAGAKNIYMEAQSATLDSGWLQKATFTVTNSGPPQPPTAVSVSPSNGSGTAQFFTFMFSDTVGAQDIVSVQLDVNASLTAAGACYLYYNSGSNQIQLANDAGSLGAALTVGAPGTIQNSQCTLNAGASSVMLSANTLTLSLVLSFKPAFAGAKNIYMEAQNATLDSGWSQKGTFIVTGGGTSQPPSTVSVTPSSGTGSSQTFAFVFSDTAGATDIFSTQMDINSSLTAAGGCYFYYGRASNQIQLANDSGSFGSALPVGTAGTLQNSQCTLDAGASSVMLSGNTLTLNLALSFKPAFAGTKNVYMEALNATLDSGWSQKGTFTTTSGGGGGGGGGTPQPPATVSVTPSSGSGASQTFAFAFSDANGATDIQSAQMDINASLTAAGACYLYYSRASNQIQLANDGGSFGTALTLGTAGTLQNSQCILDAGASSVTPSGNTLTLNLALSFKPAFVGAKNIFMEAQNATLDSGWALKGSFTTTSGGGSGGGGTPQPPSAVSVTPASGSGSSQTFAFVFSDTAGAADIASIQLDINAALTAAGACYLYYGRASNQIQLANDSGSFGAPLTVGTAGTTQNSQCTLDAGASSVMLSGNTLTLNVALSFKPAFTGAKNIYMEVQNATLDSGWSKQGTFSVP